MQTIQPHLINRFGGQKKNKTNQTKNCGKWPKLDYKINILPNIMTVTMSQQHKENNDGAGFHGWVWIVFILFDGFVFFITVCVSFIKIFLNYYLLRSVATSDFFPKKRNTTLAREKELAGYTHNHTMRRHFSPFRFDLAQRAERNGLINILREKARRDVEAAACLDTGR